MATKYSRYSTTMYNRARRVEDRVRSLFADYRIFHMNFERFLDRWEELMNSPDYRKLNSYYKGFISGLERGLTDEVNRNLEWRMYLDGEYLTSEQVNALVRSGDSTAWSRIQSDMSQHFWKGTNIPHWQTERARNILEAVRDGEVYLQMAQ